MYLNDSVLRQYNITARIVNECAAVCGMRMGRGNWSTWRKPALMKIPVPEIPNDLTWDQTHAAVMGSRQVIAWALARPMLNSVVHCMLISCFRENLSQGMNIWKLNKIKTCVWSRQWKPWRPLKAWANHFLNKLLTISKEVPLTMSWKILLIGNDVMDLLKALSCGARKLRC